MAQLVLPYPDFQPNTKIVSAQIDANNAAILNLLNGNLGPDNLLFPFLATGTLGADKSGTATAVAQGYNSRDLVLRGSGWDGAAAQARDIILRQIITGSAAYRLAFLKKEGAVETELLAINQAGSIVGSLVPDANGTRALGSAVARWDAFIDALDATGASSLGAISAIGAIAASLVADANAVRNLGAAATRWNAIYGASLDLSGQLLSSVATGTSPLSVASTTAVANLNADLLDGAHSDATATANTVAQRDAKGQVVGFVPGARVFPSADQNIVNAVWATLAFNSEVFDTDGIHDNAVNNSRLTCATAGTYLIVGAALFANNTTGYRGLAIRRNGTTHLAELQQPPASGTGTVLEVSAIYPLAANDYVELQAVQSSGAALAVQAAQTHFSMIKVG